MKRRLIAAAVSVAVAASALLAGLVYTAADSIETLSDAITAAEAAAEGDFTPRAWKKLQEKLDLAKRLSRDQKYYAIRADVPDEAMVLWDDSWPSGHNNFNKYVSLFEYPSTQAYLAYKGHGENAYDKSEFTADQLWEKVVVDEDKGVFMLLNLERDQYLCGMRKIEGTYTWEESVHQYMTVLNLNEIRDMKRAQFTLGVDNVMWLEYMSPAGDALYVDFYKSNDTLWKGQIQGIFTFPDFALRDVRSREPYCAFEEVAVEEAAFSKEKAIEQTIADIKALLGLRKSGALGSLSAAYDEAVGDLPRHYASADDYTRLQEYLGMADALMSGDTVRLIHAGTEKAAAASEDGFVRLANQNKSDFSQIWYQFEAQPDYFQLQNAGYGTYLYHSAQQIDSYASIVDFGHYVKHGGQPPSPESALFTVGLRRNLQPRLNRSATVSHVSAAFMAPDGTMFVGAGTSDERAVRLDVVDIDSLRQLASDLITKIQSLRTRRLPGQDDTLERLSALIAAVGEKTQDDYTASSWEKLEEPYAQARALAAQGSPTAAQINLAVFALENAIAGLHLKTGTAPAASPAYDEVLEILTPLYDAFRSKAYTKGSGDQAEARFSAAMTAANQGKDGTSLKTYGEMDQLCRKAVEVYGYLVEQSYYDQLVNVILSITDRESSPANYGIRLSEERYQPVTWEMMMTAYTAADRMLKDFDRGRWETPGQNVKSVSEELKAKILTLTPKPDYGYLSKILSMLDGMKLDKTVFTADSWASFETAFEVAHSVIGDENTAQSAIDALTGELITSANALRINSTKGEMPLLPGLTADMLPSVKDRYDDGYDEGYIEGFYGIYESANSKGYSDGVKAGQSAGAETEVETVHVPADPEIEIADPVREVARASKRTLEKSSLSGSEARLPVWLIVLIAAGAPALTAGGFFGSRYFWKRAARKKTQ